MEAEELQEELTCPICLDFFNDPVSIECGHNFCRRCLRRGWTPADGLFLCPECRQPSAPGALRPNWALARLTEKTRRRRQGPVPPGLCGRHWEPLRLFCEDDQRPVCLVCRESQEHQDHAMAPVDEAFESYRVSPPRAPAGPAFAAPSAALGDTGWLPGPIGGRKTPLRLKEVVLRGAQS